MNKRKAVGPVTRYIAGELRAQRARLGYTLDELAERSGVNRATANRILSGDQAIPTEYLAQLCAGLDLNIGELLNEAAKHLE